MFCRKSKIFWLFLLVSGPFWPAFAGDVAGLSKASCDEAFGKNGYGQDCVFDCVVDPFNLQFVDSLQQDGNPSSGMLYFGNARIVCSPGRERSIDFSELRRRMEVIYARHCPKQGDDFRPMGNASHHLEPDGSIFFSMNFMCLANSLHAPGFEEISPRH